MKSSAFLVSIVLLGGCAAVTEEQLEAREYRDVEWQAQYFQYKANCENNGGVVVIHGTKSRFSRDNAPAFGDLYRCHKR